MTINNKKVLIADTSERCVDLAKRVLMNNGIQEENIITMCDGQDVIKKTKEELFDLIILNTRLKSLSGIETAEIIKKNRTGKLPQVLGYAGDIHGIDNLFDGFVLKGPSGIIDLQKKTYELLNIEHDIENLELEKHLE